jgi:hypothetical protein
MEYLTKKNLDDNIHIILGVLIIILVILFITDSYSKPLPSSMYPFKGHLDKKISKEQFEMLKRNYDYFAVKFLKKMTEDLKDNKDKIINVNKLSPIVNKNVAELWKELLTKPDEERIAVTNMFNPLNISIKDLDKEKIKETLKFFYTGPLPEILN